MPRPSYFPLLLSFATDHRRRVENIPSYYKQSRDYGKKWVSTSLIKVDKHQQSSIYLYASHITSNPYNNIHLFAMLIFIVNVQFQT